MSNLMAARRQVIEVLDVCKRVMEADRDIGNPPNPRILQTATSAATRLADIDTEIELQGASRGR